MARNPDPGYGCFMGRWAIYRIVALVSAATVAMIGSSLAQALDAPMDMVRADALGAAGVIHMSLALTSLMRRKAPN